MENRTRTDKMIIGTIISKNKKERNFSVYLLVLKDQLYRAFNNFLSFMTASYG